MKRRLFFPVIRDRFADRLFGDYTLSHDGPVFPFEFHDGGRKIARGFSGIEDQGDAVSELFQKLHG